MKYALLIVEKPKSEGTGTQALREFADCALGEQWRISKDSTLNVGAWLLPLDNGMRELSGLVEEAASRGLRTHTLFFDQAPPFVTTSGGDQ